MVLRILFVLLLLCSLPAVSAESRTLLVIGDSLSAAYGIDRSEGWVSLLSERLEKTSPQWQVVNASVSGDTSRTALGRLDSAIMDHQPDLVIIAIGGNDGLRGLSFDALRDNLVSMIETAQKRDVEIILVGLRMPPNYGQDYNKAFEAIYTELADEYQLPLVPRMLADVADHPGMMQPDGIHPVVAGQPIMLENVWRILEPHI